MEERRDHLWWVAPGPLSSLVPSVPALSPQAFVEGLRMPGPLIPHLLGTGQGYKQEPRARVLEEEGRRFKRKLGSRVMAQ